MLWISGDTVLFDGVRQVADRLQIDTAVLHLGGVQFPITGPVRYSMTAKDAVELCGLIRPRTAIPIHYEGWTHFKQGRRGHRTRARAWGRGAALGGPTDVATSISQSSVQYPPSRRTEGPARHP